MRNGFDNKPSEQLIKALDILSQKGLNPTIEKLDKLFTQDDFIKIDRFIRRLVESRLAPTFDAIIVKERHFFKTRTSKKTSEEKDEYLTQKICNKIGIENFNQLKLEVIQWLIEHPDKKNSVLIYGEKAKKLPHPENYRETFKCYANVIETSLILDKNFYTDDKGLSVLSLSFKVSPGKLMEGFDGIQT